MLISGPSQRSVFVDRDLILKMAVISVLVFSLRSMSIDQDSFVPICVGL